MTKLQKKIAVFAGAAGIAVLNCFAVPVSGSDLNDGDTIFHLPFDGSMDSVSVKTFSSAGGGISYPSLPPCDVFLPAQLIVRGSTKGKNVKMTKSLIALAISMFTYFHTSAIAHAGVAQAYPGDKYVEATISAA